MFHHSKNLLLLCAARSPFDLNIPEDFWVALNSLNHSAYFVHREIPNMESQETMQLVHKQMDKKRGGHRDEEIQSIAHAVHILSSGNPLMASEILNKLYLKFAPDDEENLENLGYIGELLMNRLDSLNATVLNHLNLGALLGHSFYLDEMVAIMAIYNQVSESALQAHKEQVLATLQVAVDNGILFMSTTSTCLYSFTHQSAGRAFDIDELVDERMKTLGIPPEDRDGNVELVWSVLEKRVQSGILQKFQMERTTFTFSHEFWQKSIGWRTLDSWKNEMLLIKGEWDALKRARRQSLFVEWFKSRKNSNCVCIVMVIDTTIAS